MPKKPRINKSKEQITEEMQRNAKIQHDISLCKLIWPYLETLDTIYDAQTVLNGLAGFISSGLEKKIAGIKVSEVEIDLSKEEESKIRTAFISLMGLLEIEDAKASSDLLIRFGSTLSKYGAAQYLKNPMSTLKVEDIIA